MFLSINTIILKKIAHQSQILKIISRYISFMAIATFKNTYVLIKNLKYAIQNNHQ